MVSANKKIPGGLEVVFVPLCVQCKLIEGPRKRWDLDSRSIVNVKKPCTAEVSGKGWAIYAEYLVAAPMLVAPEFTPVSSGRVLRVLHLFSGPQRDGDFEHWCKVLGNMRGV